MSRIANDFPKAPWGFDGHGINDREGQRICKVSCCEPYLYDSGTPERNVGFDRLNVLIPKAPEMAELLREILPILLYEREYSERKALSERAERLLAEIEGREGR